jgi:hypothetical protein
MARSERERARAAAWAQFFPRIDPRSGLHAADCDCRRCEEGHRPTAAMREAAIESRRRAAAATVAREKADAEERVARERASRSALRTAAHVAADRAEAARALRALASVPASLPPEGGFRRWMQEQEQRGKAKT